MFPALLAELAMFLFLRSLGIAELLFTRDLLAYGGLVLATFTIGLPAGSFRLLGWLGWGISDAPCGLTFRSQLNMKEYPHLDAWLKASIERPAARRARKLREKDDDKSEINRQEIGCASQVPS